MQGSDYCNNTMICSSKMCMEKKKIKYELRGEEMPKASFSRKLFIASKRERLDGRDMIEQ